ncbi:MAG: family 20 glycosylhydrolase [Thermoguttaceae bacterium]
MKRLLIGLILFAVWGTLVLSPSVFAQRQRVKRQTPSLDAVMPIRGLCIAIPAPQNVDRFVQFIEQELVPGHLNTLILRVDYNFEFEEHPELRSANPHSKESIRKLVEVCRRHKIKLIPHIPLLGHQSWADTTGLLLAKYPEFDETPLVKTENYTPWPNRDRLYCKSYCPLHPDVHAVVFSLVDEMMTAFEATDFHGGMDETFYIGEEQCPRCSGKDKAELFAGEVNKIRDFLAEKGHRLWIWGDRLINGKESGVGEWEGAYNETDRAIDLIAKDVFICDWHYERPELTSVLFAIKGFDVVSCPWKKPEPAASQIRDMIAFREQVNRRMGRHFQGVIQTVWGSAEGFMDQFEQEKASPSPNNAPIESEAACFLRVLQEIDLLAKQFGQSEST